MPTKFQDPEQELANVIAYLERKRQVINTVSSVTPDTALAMSEYAAYFPTASPGIVRALAQGGVDPDHPAARFAITQDMLRKQFETGDYGGRLGTRKGSSRTSLPPEIRAAMDKAKRTGVYLEDSDLIIKPTDDTAQASFSPLVNAIYEATGKPVPFLDVATGTVRAFDPNYKDFMYGDPHNPGEYTLDPRTNELVEPGKDMDSEYWAIQAAALQTASQSSGHLSFATRASLAQHLMGASQMYGGLNQEELSAAAESDPSHADKYIKAGLDVGNVGSPTFFTRPLAMAFDAPLQEFQGLVRKTVGAINGEDINWLQSQSDLGVVLPRLARGQDIDLGTGFFVDPDSAVARERRAREAEAGQIGGHNITLGRLVASTVSEPDTKPFQIISGLTDGALQVADPSAYVLGKAKNISVAMNTFQPDEAAGTFRTFRNFFHGPTADSWLNRNTALIDRLAATRDPYEIAKLTNFKLPPDLTANLAGATTPYNIRGILDGAISKGRIRQPAELIPKKFFGVNPRDFWSAVSPKHNPYTLRLFQGMPSEVWDLEDQAQVARNAVRVLHNANAPESDIAAAYNLIARAKTKNGLRTAVMDVQTRVGGVLEHHGISDPDIRSYLTRTNQDTYTEHARGLVDDIGADVPVWEHMSVNGTITKIPGPHLTLEHISRYIHTPDLNEIRRLTSKYPFLTTSSSRDFVPVLKQVRRRLGYEKVVPTGELRLPFAFLDAAMSKVLKPMWLLRLAWPVRVVGEEQLRMSAAG